MWEVSYLENNKKGGGLFAERGSNKKGILIIVTVFFS